MPVASDIGRGVVAIVEGQIGEGGKGQAVVNLVDEAICALEVGARAIEERAILVELENTVAGWGDESRCKNLQIGVAVVD